MTRAAPRILCVDSSARRLRELKDVLEQAGFEVWTALGAMDAVCLASGLHFDVVALDQASSRLREEIWSCLADLQPGLPILVHSGTPKVSALCRHSQVISSGPAESFEVLLALLFLLLGGHSSEARASELSAA
jgi:DNA-binding NtrC family response regulator